MKVALEKKYPMPGSPGTVWSFLQNIEGVARCMPGAKITERLDDTHFKGTVAVKVGPASMSFKGNIEVLELDETQHTLHLVGKGSDSSGTSGASMDLIARVEPGAAGYSCNLIGKSEVSMSGKAAAFGGRMMGTVADQILNQFAANFAKQVAAIAAEAAAAPVAPPATIASTPVATPAVALESAPTAVTAELAAVATPPAAAAPAVASTPVPLKAANDSPDEPANEINALALFWAIIRDWFRGLFRRRPA